MEIKHLYNYCASCLSSASQDVVHPQSLGLWGVGRISTVSGSGYGFLVMFEGFCMGWLMWSCHTAQSNFSPICSLQIWFLLRAFQILALMALGLVWRLALPIMLNIFVQLFHLVRACSSLDTNQPPYSFGSCLKRNPTFKNATKQWQNAVSEWSR